MKKILFLAPLLLGATLLQAQGDCSKNHPVYNVDASSAPKKVYTLGSDPEFPFLRNLSSRQQVVNALHSPANRKKYPGKMREMDKMLQEIGFPNGTKDVMAGNVNPITIPAGTTGNMGNGHMNYSYTNLSGRPHKAWKISSGDCYISFLSTCGNAFYDNGAQQTTAYTGKKPQCDNMAVNINSEPKEITVSEPSEIVKKKTYVYFKKGCGCTDCGPSWSKEAYENGILSRPLLVKTEKEAAPLTYKVTTNSTGNAVVCKGKTTEVNADIIVEKQNEYTGYNPDDVKKEYIEVSRREYEQILREKDVLKNVLQREAHEECTTCK
jgi:hypothetical protein